MRTPDWWNDSDCVKRKQSEKDVTLSLGTRGGKRPVTDRLNHAMTSYYISVTLTHTHTHKYTECEIERNITNSKTKISLIFFAIIK